MPVKKTREQAEQTLLNAVFGWETVSLHKNLLGERLDEVLKTLTYREREVLKLRYGIGSRHAYTLAEVGEMFKVTRERVRQVEAKAIRKLQHPARARKLWELLCPIPLVSVAEEFPAQQPSLITNDQKDEILDQQWNRVFIFSARARRGLERLRVHTVRDLTMKTERDFLWGLRNFGETSLNEVKRELKQKGLSLAAI